MEADIEYARARAQFLVQLRSTALLGTSPWLVSSGGAPCPVAGSGIKAMDLTARSSGIDAGSFTYGNPHKHGCPTTIQHWQLRDLLVSGDQEHELYTVYEGGVLSYNTETLESTAIVNLSFMPNSMTFKDGFLAAGGLHGELAVRDVVQKRTVFNSHIGNSVNNALHIARMANGDLQLFVCNNDHRIKVYRLPDMSIVCEVRYNTAVNYAALSPDRRLLACVGDSNETSAFQAVESGYARLISWAEADDFGFCCAWAPGGSLLASAHQDGTCTFFDVRASKPVHKYKLASAARNVKFSSGVMDLVAISEHEDVVHLADLRKWECVQQLNPGMGKSRDVSGIAFSARGDSLCVGLDDYLMSYDMDTAARRCFGSAALC